MDTDRWILIPGFMKAGSTSVFSWLEEALPSPVARPKEPRFFLQDAKGQQTSIATGASRRGAPGRQSTAALDTSIQGYLRASLRESARLQ